MDDVGGAEPASGSASDAAAGSAAAAPLLGSRCRPFPSSASLEQQDDLRVLIPHSVGPVPAASSSGSTIKGQRRLIQTPCSPGLEQHVELPRLSRVTAQPQLKKISRPGSSTSGKIGVRLPRSPTTTVVVEPKMKPVGDVTAGTLQIAAVGCDIDVLVWSPVLANASIARPPTTHHSP